MWLNVLTSEIVMARATQYNELNLQHRLYKTDGHIVSLTVTSPPYLLQCIKISHIPRKRKREKEKEGREKGSKNRRKESSISNHKTMHRNTDGLKIA